MTAEQTNVLRQCLLRGEWADGIRCLVNPLRIGLYRLRHRKPSANKVAEAPALRYPKKAADAIEPGAISPILREAQMQIDGIYRLAGGSYHELSTTQNQEFEDPENLHSYHRLYWAVRYARAFALGHSASAEAFERDWNRWLTIYRVQDTVANAAYTTAERIASLGEVLSCNSNSPGLVSPTLEGLIRNRIESDARHLSGHIETHLGVHNHLLNDARGLAAAATAIPEAPDARLWLEHAFQLWDQFFPALVHEDGSLAEQSSHYHVLLCRTALEYFLLAKRNGRSLPKGFETRIGAMFELASDFWRTDGSLPRFGDSSPDRTAIDLSGLLEDALASGLLPRSVRSNARLYPHGGYAFLRCPENGAELAIHADPDPFTRAHADAGRGSFEVWRKGIVVIREPGCFLQAGSKRSAWYRSTKAQNVTTLNGLGPSISINDTRALPAWYRPNSGEWTLLLPGPAVQFTNPAFERLRPGLRATRCWKFEGTDLVFEETLSGKGSVQFESRLFLGAGPWSDLNYRNGTWTLRSKSYANAILYLTLPAEITVKVERAQYTPEYGVEFDAEVIVLQGPVVLPMQWSVRCEFFE